MKFFFIFLFSISIFSEKIKFILSSNLNGNLYSCPCGKTYSVGLAKRFTFLKQNHLADSILLDAGNFNSDFFEKNKSKAIIESFEKMKYQSISLGANDLNEELISSIFLSSNIIKKSNKTILYKEITILNQKNFKIGIISFFSKNELYKINPKIFSELEFKDLDFIFELIKKNNINYTVLLTNSNYEESLEISKKLKSGFIYSSYILEKKINLTKNLFFSKDKNGDSLFVLEIQTDTNKILNQKYFNLDYSKLKDDSQILEIISKHEIKVPKEY